jgi:beta-lactamase superfamily II metal-dependent hydrolase
MLRFEMLPANDGDCLWIEYGDQNKPWRILIDGGTSGSAKPLVEKVKALPPEQRRFELLVVTHVDADHIAGVLKLIETPTLGLSMADVWFNAYKHLLEEGNETFGPEQGEQLSADIKAGNLPWNVAFGGQAVRVPDVGQLPVKKLAGDMELVVLGPTMEKLRLLTPVWVQACKDAGIKPGKPSARPRPAGLETFGPINVEALADTPLEEDQSEANGSSITLLMRYHGATVLLSGDGHPSIIQAGVDRLGLGDKPLRLDGCKVPHHGGPNNLSSSLLARIDCARYLFSTSGARHGHPSREAVARVLKYGRHSDSPTELVFNYRSKYNSIWDSPDLRRRWRYTTVFPVTGQAGVVGFTAP